MISKKLLSEVLGEEIFEIEIYSANYIKYNIGVHISGVAYKSVNIHELAHKCKEWAYDSDYIIQSSLSYTQVFKRGEINHVFDCFAEQEPEAIFKACQWVLENKDK